MKFLTRLNPIQKTLVIAILATVVYALTASVSYSAFSMRQVADSGSEAAGSKLPGAANKYAEDPREPKTEECPLNGSMHTKKAKALWDTRRPLAVMIENHTEARPQSGVSFADVVYEAVAEGGITRFQAVYLCNSLADVQVGPVRSARTYFLDWAPSELDALYAHVGGANCTGGPADPGCQNGAPADALGQIITYKIKDLNQFGIGYPTFWRDYQRLGHSVATEHTMYSSTDKLWAIGAKKGWTASDSAGIRWDAKVKFWKFKDDAAASGTTTQVHVNFWEGYNDFAVDWTFDKTCNCYKRNNGGSAHLDLDVNEQLSAKNVVVQFMRESHANDGYENNAHLLYQNKGQGKALIFQNGQAIEGTWNKQTRTSREIFMDSSGKEIEFTRGLIWIQTVPEGSKVTY